MIYVKNKIVSVVHNLQAKTRKLVRYRPSSNLKRVGLEILLNSTITFRFAEFADH